jgi:hypothetical protein
VLWRLKEENHEFEHSKFQARKDYTARHYLRKEKKRSNFPVDRNLSIRTTEKKK